jgi:hypothetical protein
MKAGFSLTKRFVPSFNGNKDLPTEQQLIAVLAMPEVQDVFAILERLSAAGFKAGEASSVSMSQATQIAKEAGQFIPKYVKLDNAEDFSVGDVIKYPPYFPLATELLFALVDFAQPNEADVKNS